MECSLTDNRWHACVLFILSVMLHVYPSGAEMCNFDSRVEWLKASWLMRHRLTERQTNIWQERGTCIHAYPFTKVHWSNHSLIQIQIPQEPLTHFYLTLRDLCCWVSFGSHFLIEQPLFVAVGPATRDRLDVWQLVALLGPDQSLRVC